MIVVPLLIAAPLLFGVFGAVFRGYAKEIGILAAVIWVALAVLLLFEVESGGRLYYDFAQVAPPLGIGFAISGFGTLMVLLSAVVILAAMLYNAFLERGASLFYPLVCFLASGLGVVFLSNDIFNIYVGLELIGLSAVALAAYGSKAANIKAAINYLFATLTGSGFYLLAVALLYAKYGVLSLELLSELVRGDGGDGFIFLLFAVALTLKTALFPLFFWLPQAHGSAIAPVSALLSALVVKSSFYILLLLYVDIFDFAVIGEFLAYLGIAAILYGGLKALLCVDIKLLVAYSTLSQIGYLFLVFGLESPLGMHGALFQILSHGLAKAGLFLAAGVVVYCFAKKDISRFQGIGSTLGVTTFAIALSGMSLIGLPPSLGFFAKWNYLLAGFADGAWVIISALIVGSALGIGYIFKILLLALQQPNHSIILHTKALRGMEYIALILSGLSLLLGFFAGQIIDMAGI